MSTDCTDTIPDSYKPWPPHELSAPNPPEFETYLTTYNTDIHSGSLERHAIFSYTSETWKWEVVVGRWDTIWAAIAIWAVIIIGITMLLLIARTLLIIMCRYSPRTIARGVRIWKRWKERETTAQKAKEEIVNRPEIVVTEPDDKETLNLEKAEKEGLLASEEGSAASSSVSDPQPRKSRLLKLAWNVCLQIVLCAYAIYLQLYCRSIAVAVANNDRASLHSGLKPELIALWPWPGIWMCGGALLTTLILLVSGRHVEWMESKLLIVQSMFVVSITSISIFGIFWGTMAGGWVNLVLNHFLEMWIAMLFQLKFGLALEKHVVREGRLGSLRKGLQR